MLRFLFWNLRKRPIIDVVGTIVADRAIDVVLLAEVPTSPAILAAELSREAQRPYSWVISPSQRISIYVAFPSEWVKPIRDGGDLSMHHVRAPLFEDFLLAVVHLPSKLYASSEDQLLACVRAAKHVEEAEQKIGHRRTIVVGDFNLNPFEPGLTAADAFNAVMDKAIARRSFRVVQGVRRHFFYNPLWSRLGDTSVGPPGTYYYSSNAQTCYYWNTFDQVLVRPDLLSGLPDIELEVLTTTPARTLTTPEGHPSREGASDHLPMTFRLQLPMRSRDAD